VPTSPEIRASTILGNSKCQIEPPTYVHFNESLISDKHDWQLLSLKNRQTCCKSHHLYTPHAIVNRVEVRRVRRPECGWDKTTKSGDSCASSATVSLARCDEALSYRKTKNSLSDATRMSWSVLQEQVYRTKISDVGELKRRIKNEWADLNHAITERVVGEWRLSACVHAGCEHLEHDVKMM